MSKIFSPKITTDGLVMCLDASQNKSYPTTDLPVKNGLVMWMDAADDTTFSYSSGTTVSQWRDKSGFNYHMTPLAGSPTRNAFQNSRKVVAFTTAQDIQNTSIDLRTSPYTVFIVSRYTSPSAGTGRILTSNGGYNNWLLGHWASEVNKYYANGWVYSTYAAVDTNWKLYLGDWGGSSNNIANFYAAGTALATNSSAATAGPWTLGINANSGERSNCEAAEIIVFNRLLSTVERNLIHTYLGQKWGISNADRSIIDLAGNDDNGLLGNGTTANMPVFDYYNKGGLKFDGSNDYALCPSATVNALNGNSITVEAWIKHSSFGGISDGRTYISNWSSFNTLDQKGFILRTYVNQTFPSFWWCWGGGNNYDAQGPSSYVMNLNQIYHVVATYLKGTGLKIYINGNLEATFTTNTNNTIAFDTTNGVHIGYSPINTSYMDGNIYVARLYNRALSAAEVSQNYEAQKSRFANTIVQQGLVLNLDAGNPYSYAGAGTTWYDVSTSNNNSTLTNGPTYSSDSGGGIVFDGVDDYVNLNSGNAINNWNPDGINASTSYRSYTSANIWFKVSTISTGGVQKMIFSDAFMEYGFSYTNNTLYFMAFSVQSTTIAANTWYNACLVADVGRPGTGNYTQSGTTTITCTTNYPIPFVTGNTIFITFSSGTATSGNYVATVTGTYTFTITAASAATTSGGFYYSHSSNTSTVTAYLNGVQIGSPVTGNSSNGLNDIPFVLGRDGGGVAGSNFAGSIALFQLYSKALSAAEVLQNYNATKGRFGL